jgi:hypothetical protein
VRLRLSTTALLPDVRGPSTTFALSSPRVRPR